MRFVRLTNTDNQSIWVNLDQVREMGVTEFWVGHESRPATALRYWCGVSTQVLESPEDIVGLEIEYDEVG